MKNIMKINSQKSKAMMLNFSQKYRFPLEVKFSNDENTVGSWEDLPGGDYLDPDEHGTVWFRANNGDNWYQNSDGTWTKWID